MCFDYIREEGQLLKLKKLSLAKFWQNLDQTPLSFLLLYSCQKFSQLSTSKNPSPPPKFIPTKWKMFISLLSWLLSRARFYFTAAVKFLISVKTWKEWGGECRSELISVTIELFSRSFKPTGRSITCFQIGALSNTSYKLQPCSWMWVCPTNIL